ncbi:hypothetical protein COB55_02015 [Candidatus Wolfebacteria bacterium]|nr:MAG: hypothetical protein COB55_02015 [Candidatus Wolfebacteria bacterium]
MGTVILIFCLFITPVLLGVGALSALLHHLGEPPSGFGEALVLSFYFLIASGFVAFLGKIARDFASVFTSKILLPFTCLIFKGEEKGGKGVENILTYHLSFLDTWMEFKKGISISKRELWSAIRLVSFLFIAPTLVILVGTLAVSGLVIFACILAVDVIITIMLGLAINKSLAAGVGGLAGVSLMVFSYPEPNTFAFILFPILGGLIGIGFRRLRVWLEDVQPMPEPVTA